MIKRVLNEVYAENARNIAEASVSLSEGVNVFCGENAQGKTNFLECVYMLCTGRSFKGAGNREFIRFGEEYTNLRGTVSDSGSTDSVEIRLQAEKKLIYVNGVGIKKLGELYGLLHGIVFSPEDLSLVKQGPGERRRFMDVELCQLSKIYYYNIKQYHHILKQRNNLLKSIKQDGGLRDTTEIWDLQLVSYGADIIKARREFARNLLGYAEKIYFDLSGGERFNISYKPNTEEENFGEKLKRGLERDIFLGSTGNGIHKDELLFSINGDDTKVYGSQGQQRSVCLCLKLAALSLARENTGRTPLLLLDDVLSELDDSRQKYVLNLALDVQTLISATGGNILKVKNADRHFLVEGGKILLT
ncbi:DNA replication and repair protein RecF [Clostridia bacterium]|nr:DNA replication and repair protein RecF [Clostridia bacterium]